MADEKMDRIERAALARYQKLQQDRKREAAAAAGPETMDVRRSVINPHDSLAAERIIHRSDLFPIAYLEAGLIAAKSVCRISLRNHQGQIKGYGTGFLISPSLILTNNHVVDSYDTALNAVAEFNYEDDVNFMPRTIVPFRLEPERLFITDEALDFSVIAVQEKGLSGARVSDFGYLPLLPMPGKILEGEYVSIIQHPKGGPKAVTVRENEVKFLSDHFVHYASDTEPGSSGSPVFNDQWIVSALHHAGVPDPADPTKWIANEGIRISSILHHLHGERGRLDAAGASLLDGVLPEAPIPDSPAAPIEVGELAADWYNDAGGYDPAFLGEGLNVPLPPVKDAADVAETLDGGKELDYTHFSIVMSRSRRLAYYSAVNIDGSQLVEVKRSNDKWYFDPRMAREFQSGPELYARNDLDRGHLTRRQDPNWGRDAVQANAHTFHFTNSAPQHKGLNQKTWLSLEDYILENAGANGFKVNVFTGPVFRDDDVVYRGEFRIPAEFWKVAVMAKEDGALSATAYLLTQRDLIGDLEFAYGPFQTFQVPLALLDELAGIDWSALQPHDPLANVEGAGARLIAGRGDIRL